MPVVSLPDVKTYLKITRTDNDGELGDFLAGAIAAVEDVIGPLAAQTVTEEFDEHGPRIVLSRTPVLSLSSVVIEPWLGAAAVDDTAAWRLNPTTGVLRRMVVGGSLPFYGRGSIFTVTYTAGRADVPAPVNRAILMQVREMWKSQRGSMPVNQTGAENPPSIFGGTQGFLGAEVMELLTPYIPPPGVA